MEPGRLQVCERPGCLLGGGSAEAAGQLPARAPNGAACADSTGPKMPIPARLDDEMGDP